MNTPSHLEYLVIEGVIGAGKTTLAGLLAKAMNARLLLERFEDNPFLAEFYTDRERFAFPVEMSFLADRYRQMKEALPGPDLFGASTVADFGFYKTWLFASVNLKGHERQLFHDFFRILNRDLPQPTAILFLDPDTQTLQDRIYSRGRSYEQNIPADYLAELHRSYMQYLRSREEIPVYMLQGSWDFLERPEELTQLVEGLTENRKPGRHVLRTG